MGELLNPDNKGFQNALSDDIYVDKSMLIDYTNSVVDTEQCYVCVTRPRRFGKTMAADMLAAYYSRGCDSRQLFSGLKIAQTPDFENHLNQYNVVHLNVVDFVSEASDAFEMISLIESDLIEEIEDAYPNVKYPRRLTLVKALEAVSTQTGISFVFVIDEWDCIFRERENDRDGQKAYLDFLRALLKDKGYVALAYMTGILPIKKFGTHSSLNNFDEFSMLFSSPISEFTGFTEGEVEELCLKHGVSFDEMKRWFAAYNVDGTRIYNPLSVVDSIFFGCFDTYWNATETYLALKEYIDLDLDGLRSAVQRLIAGERVVINPGKFQNDMVTFKSADDVLTLLVHLGYLTYDDDRQEVWIPNSEVAKVFSLSVADWK